MAISFVGGRESKKRRRTARLGDSRRGEKFWTEEKERKNFGLSYMEKYGWSQGDGLGTKRQGGTTHLRAKVKHNNRGIGSKNTADNTMLKATALMFNDILAGLNKKKKSTSITTQGQNASSLIRSYEVKHHLYGKFRAAKQIKNRSAEDKAAIFGVYDGSGPNIGFTEDDQANYAMHLTQMASARSGRSGLGMGGSSQQSGGNVKLTFGAFRQSGMVTKEVIMDHEDGGNGGTSKVEKSVKSEKKKSKKKRKKSDEVRRFLKGISSRFVDKYYGLFVDRGVDSMQKIGTLSDDKLKELGISKTKHRKKILLAVGEWQSKSSNQKKKDKKRKLEVESMDSERTAKRRKKKQKRKEVESESSDSIFSAPVTPRGSDDESKNGDMDSKPVVTTSMFASALKYCTENPE